VAFYLSSTVENDAGVDDGQKADADQSGGEVKADHVMVPRKMAGIGARRFRLVARGIAGPVGAGAVAGGSAVGSSVSRDHCGGQAGGDSEQ
jgi:hypothetical protein